MIKAKEVIQEDVSPLENEGSGAVEDDIGAIKEAYHENVLSVLEEKEELNSDFPKLLGKDAHWTKEELTELSDEKVERMEEEFQQKYSKLYDSLSEVDYVEYMNKALEMLGNLKQTEEATKPINLYALNNINSLVQAIKEGVSWYKNSQNINNPSVSGGYTRQDVLTNKIKVASCLLNKFPENWDIDAWGIDHEGEVKFNIYYKMNEDHFFSPKIRFQDSKRQIRHAEEIQNQQSKTKRGFFRR